MSEVTPLLRSLVLLQRGESLIKNFDIMNPTVFFGLIIGVAILLSSPLC